MRKSEEDEIAEGEYIQLAVVARIYAQSFGWHESGRPCSAFGCHTRLGGHASKAEVGDLRLDGQLVDQDVVRSEISVNQLLPVEVRHCACYLEKNVRLVSHWQGFLGTTLHEVQQAGVHLLHDEEG